MILRQSQQRDRGNILLCQTQSRFSAAPSSLPRASPNSCPASGTMTATKKSTPDISRNNIDLVIRNQDCRNPDILKNNVAINSAGRYGGMMILLYFK